jgi:hypothetical protein
MRPVDVGSGQPPGLQELRDQQHAVKAAAQFLPADHLQRRRLRHHVTAQRGVAAALPRPSRPGRRAPPATRSGQPGKPGGGHGHGMNDGLRRTQRALAPGGEGKGSLRSMPDYAPASYVAIMSQIRGSLSLHLLCLSPVPAGLPEGGWLPPAGRAGHTAPRGTASRVGAMAARQSPPAEAVTAVDIPPGHENSLMVTGAVPRSAPRCQG